MRFDTQNAGHFLVDRLDNSGIVADILEDGSNIVLLELISDHKIRPSDIKSAKSIGKVLQETHQPVEK
jgi:hypothetical protein